MDRLSNTAVCMLHKQLPMSKYGLMLEFFRLTLLKTSMINDIQS